MNSFKGVEILKKPRQPTFTGKGNGEKRYTQNNDSIVLSSFTQVFS